MGREVFMSLRAPFRIKALTLSRHLFSLFIVLLKIPRMDFRELRRRLIYGIKEEFDPETGWLLLTDKDRRRGRPR
jgi:hypothetical protein